MTIRVAINGYGRIGRDLHRQLIDMEGIEVVAINSRADAESHAYLLKYDSLYGKCEANIGVDGKDLVVNGNKVFVYQVDDPENIGWGDKDIDVVVESTGRFTSERDAEKHLRAGAKKVLITAPCNDLSIPNIVMGVNDKDYKAADFKVVSNASCTTNCLAPVAHVLNQEFGIEAAFVTTVHAFTYTQNLLDNSNPEDFRRSRATTESIIPTTTGAMKAIGRVIPELQGKMDGLSLRVPITTVSNIDMVAKLNKSVSAAEVNEAFKKYENSSMKGFLGTSTDPVVSVDFRGDSRSSIVDLPLTKTLPGGFVQVISWYDNEWGYVCRVVDLIKWLV